MYIHVHVCTHVYVHVMEKTGLTRDKGPPEFDGCDSIDLLANGSSDVIVSFIESVSSRGGTVTSVEVKDSETLATSHANHNVRTVHGMDVL